MTTPAAPGTAPGTAAGTAAGTTAGAAPGGRLGAAALHLIVRAGRCRRHLLRSTPTRRARKMPAAAPAAIARRNGGDEAIVALAATTWAARQTHRGGCDRSALSCRPARRQPCRAARRRDRRETGGSAAPQRCGRRLADRERLEERAGIGLRSGRDIDRGLANRGAE